jgi:hypothetical protein
MFDFLKKNSTSQTLPLPEELPADQVMQEIEAMQLDDDVEQIYCIVLTDKQRDQNYELLNMLIELLKQHGSTEEAINLIKELASRFNDDSENDESWQITETAAEQVDKELDPAYLFDKKLTSSNRW